MARMAIRSIVDSNRAMTEADMKAVTRLTSSHELLSRTMEKTPSEISSSPTPASRLMSSSASSSMMSTMSSMVMTPTSRPDSSTTPTERRL